MKMTIAKKINLLVYGLLGLLLVAGIFEQSGLSKMSKIGNDLMKRSHHIDRVQEVRFSFLKLAGFSHHYVISGKEQDKEQFDSLRQNTLKTIAACKDFLQTRSRYAEPDRTKKEDLHFLDDVAGEVMSIASLTQEVFQHSPSDPETGALLDQINAVCDRTTSELDALVDDTHKDSDAAIGAVGRTEARIRNFGYSVIVLMLVVGLSMGITISGPMKKAISELCLGTEKIGAGDLNYHVSVKTGDELSTLADAFNQMTDSVRDKNEELETMNEELRSTNEELETSNEELRSATEELETSNEELRSTTEELEASNEELRTTNAELEKKTDQLCRAHEKLLHHKKLAAVGQLASGIGHELRNPLGVVKNAAYYIKTKVGDSDAKLLKHLGIMEREINNANKIINDLLGFSRTRMPATQPEDVNEIIEQTLEVVQKPHNVLIVQDTDETLPKVMVDRHQIQQVLVNLCLNGIQAIGDEGGELKISTHQQDDLVQIRVTDSGCGIPEENLNNLFDPFFTTKAKGVGLGLAVTYGIIEKHRGTIDVQSQVGKGTTFIVKLPTEKTQTSSETTNRSDSLRIVS